MTPDTPNPPAAALLLKAPEVASLLNVSERSVHSWSANGRMPPSIHVGRSARWRRADIERWLGAGCPAGAKDPTP